MKIVVGLGNPGAKYRTNRHNAGYLILSELANRFAKTPPRAKFRADTLEIQLNHRSVLLLCPTTYMNNSGQSVSEAVRFYKLPPENVLVVCDDLDLPFAKIRIRPEGGCGGQKGLKDIARLLKTEKFPRLRFGIGRPPGQADPADYVLSDFSTEEKKELPLALKIAADAVECCLAEGLATAMNKYNG